MRGFAPCVCVCAERAHVYVYVCDDNLKMPSYLSEEALAGFVCTPTRLRPLKRERAGAISSLTDVQRSSARWRPNIVRSSCVEF